MTVNFRSNAVILSLILFVTGIGAGVVIDRQLLVRKKLSRAEQFKKFMGPQRFETIQKYLEKKFTRELKLDDGQRLQLRQILSEGMAGVKEKSRQHDAEIEGMKDGIRQKFAATLTSEQKTRFWELVAEYKARRARGETR